MAIPVLFAISLFSVSNFSSLQRCRSEWCNSSENEQPRKSLRVGQAVDQALMALQAVEATADRPTATAEALIRLQEVFLFLTQI